MGLVAILSLTMALTPRELIVPKVRVGDSGFFARVADTEGNVIAIWQQIK